MGPGPPTQSCTYVYCVRLIVIGFIFYNHLVRNYMSISIHNVDVLCTCFEKHVYLHTHIRMYICYIFCFLDVVFSDATVHVPF